MAALAATVRTYAPPTSGERGNQVYAYTLTGDGTVQAAIVADAAVDAADVVQVVCGWITVAGATTVTFHSGAATTVVGALEFVAKGTLAVPPMYTNPGQGLYITSDTSVEFIGSEIRLVVGVPGRIMNQ